MDGKAATVQGGGRMTCTKSCHDCIYGVPIATRKCENPNATCDGVCYQCRWAIKKKASSISAQAVSLTEELLSKSNLKASLTHNGAVLA